MTKWKKLGMTAALALGLTLFASAAAFADASQEVRDYPGFNGSGTKQNGPIEGSVSYDCWYDDEDSDDEGGPGAYSYKRGWRYSPGGWWFQYSDGSWPSNGWKYIDGRWYMFDIGGHMMTGWYTDGNGYKFYLNPTDDGTLGAMRTGWQIVDGKAYYFNTMSDGTQGRMLVNTTTPDGYHAGTDGIVALP